MNSDQNIETQIRLLDLRQQNEDLKRAKALRESYGVFFYRPHERQDKFHAAAHVTGRYCRTGNRGGKTKCGAAEDVAFALGYRPWYQYEFPVLGVRYVNENRETYIHHVHKGYEEHPLVIHGIPQRPIKILLICADWDKAQEIFTNCNGSYENWGEYFQLLPRDAVFIHKSRGGYVDRIDVKRPDKYGGGLSSIYVDTIESYKHSKISAESSDFDVIHLDEPCPRKMFIAHKRGLVDREGKFWINCTPIDEPWINDEFSPTYEQAVQDAPEGREFTRVEVGGVEKVSRFIITWSMKDNPYNSDKAIAEFSAGLTNEERECRVYGLPLTMAGLVYKEFIYDMHVLCNLPKGSDGREWPAYHCPPKDYTIRVWWDFHTRLPQAVLFVATAPDGTVFVYDELFQDNLIDPVAKLILRKVVGYNVVSYEIDPFALIKNPVDESCIVDTLATYGLFFNPATKDLSRGINKVRERLNERNPLNGLPTIFFSPNLRQTLFEFTHYVYDIEKNEPKDTDNHMMENLYRAILSGLSYVAPPSKEELTRRNRPFIADRTENLFDDFNVGSLLS